jgi:hypothetical protein
VEPFDFDRWLATRRAGLDDPDNRPPKGLAHRRHDLIVRWMIRDLEAFLHKHAEFQQLYLGR